MVLEWGLRVAIETACHVTQFAAARYKARRAEL
jgi:hypothetical protein